jgi:hypothetical protein
MLGGQEENAGTCGNPSVYFPEALYIACFLGPSRRNRVDFSIHQI